MNLFDPQLAPHRRHLAEPVRPAGKAHVSVLLGLSNGAEFLEEQLASIAGQTHDDWSLVIGDDGSRDGGGEIVHRFAADYPAHSVRLVPGPEKGFQANFLKLLGKVAPQARFVAFADQDDVWLPEKLSRAVDALASVDGATPALYGARTLLTDAALNVKGPSPRFRRKPSFRNALVQSIAGGNTMVMNRPAFELLVRAARLSGPVVSHDWWAYQVVAGAGGRVIYDPEPSLLYRQHGGNTVGAGVGLRAKAERAHRLLRGEFRRYTDMNLKALENIRDLLTAENRALVDHLSQARKAPLPSRLASLRKIGIYRQTAAGTLALWAAAALGRL